MDPAEEQVVQGRIHGSLPCQTIQPFERRGHDEHPEVPPGCSTGMSAMENAFIQNFEMHG